MKQISFAVGLLALVLISACSTPSQKSTAPTDDKPPNNVFYSKPMGFGITKPSAWHFISDDILKADRNTLRLDDAQLEKMARENPNIPLVVFTRHQEPYPTLNPSVSVTVAFLPVEGVSPRDALHMSTDLSKLAFPDLTVVEPVTDATVAGIQGAYTQVKYTAAFADGQRFPTQVRMWIVPRGKILFIVGMTGPQEGPDVFADILPDILKSIKIDQ